jgi:prepilin-type N-terminal cleavage/methylation domain-containing protein
MRLISRGKKSGFSLVELMVVISILCGLMTMVFGVQRYAQTKSRRSRVEAQIAAFSAAAEAYKSDNASYPRTDETDASTSVGALGADTKSDAFLKANLALYAMLAGDLDLNGKPDATESGTGAQNATPFYMTFSPSQLSMSDNKVKFIQDPWSQAYGYSTKRAKALETGKDDAASGHNVTFDIWSVANSPDKDKAWIGNW